MMALMQVRPSQPTDRPFLIEVARLACAPDGHPLPSGDDPDVLAILPGQTDGVVIATDDAGTPLVAPGGTCTRHRSYAMPLGRRYRKW